MSRRKDHTSISNREMSLIAIEARTVIEKAVEEHKGSSDDIDHIIARLVAGRLQTAQNPQAEFTSMGRLIDAYMKLFDSNASRSKPFAKA